MGSSLHERGRLRNRDICDNKEIINWSLKDLLKLDNGTSQWASVAVLMGNKEVIENIPYKLNITYGALEHWTWQRRRGECWNVKYDETIEKQAMSYVGFIETGRMVFVPCHSEDYCFARAFDLMTKEEGEKRWPSLKGHETNRIEEMENTLKEDIVTSKDHRVIQALVMKHRNNIEVVHKDAVKKSWPRFWDFIKEII